MYKVLTLNINLDKTCGVKFKYSTLNKNGHYALADQSKSLEKEKVDDIIDQQLFSKSIHNVSSNYMTYQKTRK